MLKLEAYTNRTIHNFASILHQCKVQGLTLQQLNEQIDAHKNVINSNKQRVIQPKCPNCGSSKYKRNLDIEGVEFIECKKCYYSEVL